MEILSVDYVLLISMAKELNQKCTCVEKEIKRLADVTETLDIFWDGESNVEFIMNINEDIVYMEAVICNTRNMIKLLLESVEAYQDTEKVINQMIGGLTL